MIKKLIVILLVCLCITLSDKGFCKTTKQKVKLEGYVKETTGAIAENAKIIIRNKYNEYIVKTNEYGKYELDIPRGVYRINVEYNGWQDIRYKNVRIFSANNNINIELKEPIPERIILINSDKKMDWGCLCDSKEYDSFSLLSDSNKELAVLIKSQKRKQINGFTLYSGTNGVMVVRADKANNLVIFADKIRFDKNILYLEASGNVVVQKRSSPRLYQEKIFVNLKTDYLDDD